MIVVTAETLDCQEIPYRTSARIQFENKLFTRGASYSKRIFQRIMAELQQDRLSNLADYLIVEIGEHFTVWHEVKPPQEDSVPLADQPQSIWDQPINERSPHPVDQPKPLAVPFREMSYRGAKYRISTPNSPSE